MSAGRAAIDQTLWKGPTLRDVDCGLHGCPLHRPTVAPTIAVYMQRHLSNVEVNRNSNGTENRTCRMDVLQHRIHSGDINSRARRLDLYNICSVNARHHNLGLMGRPPRCVSSARGWRKPLANPAGAVHRMTLV